MEGSGLRYTDFFDKAFECGIPVQLIEQWPDDKKAKLIEEMDKLEQEQEQEQEQTPEPPRSKVNSEFGQSSQKNAENPPSRPTPGG